MDMDIGNIYLIIACAAVTVTLLVIVGLFIYNHFAGMQSRTLDRMDQRLHETKRKELKEIVTEAIKESGREPAVATAVVKSQPVMSVEPEPVRQPVVEPIAKEEPPMETPVEEQAANKDPIEEILQAMSSPAPKKEAEFGYMPYQRGRSGKVYTKEELQMQIKD